MALFPCAVGLHRYSGPQQSAYLGLVNGSEAARVKQRLCPGHFQALSHSLDSELTLIAIGDTGQTEDEASVETCGHVTVEEARVTAFATLYPRGAEPHQYAQPMCEACAADFRKRYKLA